MIGSTWSQMRAPSGAAFIRSSCRPRRSCRLRTQAMVDPSPSVAHLVDALQNNWVVALNETATHLSSKLLVLGDADVAVAVTNSFADKVDTAGQVAQQSGENGPIAFLASGFENFLQLLDSGLEKLGVPYSYGFAIILLTVIVKVATFPLAKQQVESTMAMQALQPKVKELQVKHANDQEKLQLETAQLYRDAQVNPLAGCLPLLIQLPVFIGLYRALTNAASDGLLTEGFFWVPSLGGPTSAEGQGMAWLFPFVDGHPPLGWEATGAYLSLPVLLVVSQFLSQKIMAPPPSDDPAQQQTQAILRFIPLMIGYFSLNVPSGLSLYWLTNNFITTAQQVYLKSTTKVSLPDLPSSSSAEPQPILQAASSEEKVKRVTGQEMGASQRGGEKFRARKAREAAGKAAASAVVVEANVEEGKPRPGDRFRQRKARTLANASPEPTPASTAGPIEAKAEEPPQAPPAVTAVVPEVVSSTAENGSPKRSTNGTRSEN